MPRARHRQPWRPPRPKLRLRRKELGPRRKALKSRRLVKWRNRTAAGVAGATLIALAVSAGAWWTIEARDSGPEPTPTPSPTAAQDPITTILVFGTRESAPEEGALWLTLLVANHEEERGAVIAIPAHTGVEVPGRGLQGVGDSLAGGVPLLLVSTEILLGTQIDGYLDLSDRDARVLFEGVGDLSVTVPAEVRVPAGPNQARLLFTAGPQRLSPPFLVKLLYKRGIDGDDVELGSRHVAMWDALFDSFEGDPDGLRSAVESAGAALGESQTQPERHASLLAELSELEPEQRTIASLPVQDFSVAGNQLYAIDDTEVTEFLTAAIGEPPRLADEVRVQILNGNGVPGIGQEVAERLRGEGLRVILSGNARRLTYQRSRIVIYEATEQAQALAQRVRRLLGVGKVLVSAQSQGIVDVTIVVGRDFLKTL